MKRTPLAETPSAANALNLAMERASVDGEHPSWSAMLPRVKPRADGHPSTTATATTASLESCAVVKKSSTAYMSRKW
jgi:hypothetical protein